MTQERRQDERRRRRLERQQQKRQGRPQRTDGPIGDVEFGGVMGWFQRNTKWVFLAVILLFIGGGVGSTFYAPSAPPVPTPSATPSATASATASSTASATPTPDASIQRRYDAAPKFEIDPAKKYTAVLTMAKGGEVRVDLLAREAPQTVNNFVFLAKNRFYDGLTFHRVLPSFMAQGGDPRGDGTGSPGYALPKETNSLPFERGVIAMAYSGQGISGSQFFITTVPTPWLQGQTAVFGKVVAGQDVVDNITKRDPTQPNQPRADIITSVRIIEGN